MVRFRSYTFLPNGGEVCNMGKASEVVAGISDLCVPEFLAQLEQRKRLKRASVEFYSFPKLKVCVTECVCIHKII